MNSIPPIKNSLRINNTENDAPASSSAEISVVQQQLSKIPSTEAIQKKINAILFNRDELAFLNELRLAKDTQVYKDLICSHIDLFKSSPHLANALTRDGATLFFDVVFLQQWDLVKLMLENCPNNDISAGPTTGPYSGVTALWQAADAGQWSIVKLMLEHSPSANVDISPSVGSNKGLTALWLATLNKQWDIMELMLAHSANIDASPLDVPQRGITPLWIASNWNLWPIVKRMLQYQPRANFNAMPLEGCYRGQTPLWHAAFNQQWDIVELMLEHSANVDVSPIEGLERGITPLWLAASRQRWSIVKRMLQCQPHANIDATHLEGLIRGYTPLWFAAFNKQWDIVELMLEHSANVDASPIEGVHCGITPLWLATTCEHWSIVKRMLQCQPQANANAAPLNGNGQGRTALWIAATKGQWAIVRLMLKPGLHVDVAPPNTEGVTAISHAAVMQQWDIIKLMLVCHPRACLELFGKETMRIFNLKNRARRNNLQDKVTRGTILELALLCKEKPAAEVSAACILLGSFFGKCQPKPIEALRHSIESALNQIHQSYRQHLNFPQQNFFLAHADGIEETFRSALVDEFRKKCPAIAFLPDNLLLEQIARYCYIKQIIEDQDNVLHAFFSICAEENSGPLRLLRLIEEGAIFHYIASEGDVVLFDELFLQLQKAGKTDCLQKRYLIENKTVVGALQGKTALHFAAIKGCAAIAKQLAAICPQLLVEKDDQHQTAGVLANRHNHKALALDLIKASVALKTEAPLKPCLPATLSLPAGQTKESELQSNAPEKPLQNNLEEQNVKIDSLAPSMLPAGQSEKSGLQNNASERPFLLTRSNKKAEKPLPPQSKPPKEKSKIATLKAATTFAHHVSILSPLAAKYLPQQRVENIEIPVESHAPSVLKAEARKNALEWEERQNRKHALKKGKMVLLDRKPSQEVIERHIPQPEGPNAVVPALNYRRLQKRVSEANLKKSTRLTEQLITSTLESLQAEGIIDYRREGNTISANKFGDHATCLTIHVHSTTELWYRKPEVVRSFIAFVQACGLEMSE